MGVGAAAYLEAVSAGMVEVQMFLPTSESGPRTVLEKRAFDSHEAGCTFEHNNLDTDYVE